MDATKYDIQFAPFAKTPLHKVRVSIHQDDASVDNSEICPRTNILLHRSPVHHQQLHFIVEACVRHMGPLTMQLGAYTGDYGNYKIKINCICQLELSRAHTLRASWPIV